MFMVGEAVASLMRGNRGQEKAPEGGGEELGLAAQAPAQSDASVNGHGKDAVLAITEVHHTASAWKGGDEGGAPPVLHSHPGHEPGAGDEGGQGKRKLHGGGSVMGLSQKDLRLVTFCGVIIFAHTSVSWFEEALFKRMGFNEPFFMILFMCAMYSALHAAAAPFLFRHHPSLVTFATELHRRDLHRAFVALCLAYAGSNTVSKLALEYVSMPMQIVFKSCKLVAVMMGSGCIMGRRYSYFDYSVAMCLVLGMVCFAGADMWQKHEKDALDMSTIIGASILLLALSCDSVLGNLQEKMQKGGMCNELQLMYVQSLFGTVFLGILTAVTGELRAGIVRCYTDLNVLAYLFTWSALCMFGIVFMLKIAGEFSAVTAVLTSSLRKVVSLVVSYVFFPKPLTPAHALGLVFVFGAMFAHQWHKQAKKKPPPPPKEALDSISIESSLIAKEEEKVVGLPPWAALQSSGASGGGGLHGKHKHSK